MSTHLPGKIARLISDFLSLGELIRLIPHEMEKRIVARHSLVKLDALLKLLPRFKNEIREVLPLANRRAVSHLDDLIKRLRKDLESSDFETGRDGLAAHALKLDLITISDAWKCMGNTTFGVLEFDLNEIDAELRSLALRYPYNVQYPGAAAVLLEPEWQKVALLVFGDPSHVRIANIYPGFATAGVVAPVPGGNAAQDATIRASGLATFLRQVRLLVGEANRNSYIERLLAEMMLNDYCALWELLFDSGVRNEHGSADLSVAEHWAAEKFKGARCIAEIRNNPHPDLSKWKDIRNKFTAHVDPDTDIWMAEPSNWPMTVDQIINEALRIIKALVSCAGMDIRTKLFFIPPQRLGGDEVVGLAAQDGKRWAD